jgi:hypothetical protein
MELSQDLLSKVINEMKSRKQPEIYWDYNDSIDTKSIVKALEHEHPLWYLQDDIWERNMDYIYELEIDFIKDCLEEFSDEIEDESGCDCIDYKKLANELRDDLLDYVSVGLDIKGLLRGTENLRVTMYSNNDCMNSFWFESQGGFNYDSYLGDCIDTLQLNPQAVKKLLVDKGYKVYGTWPNKPKRNPYVKIEDFWTELENQTCPAVNLTLLWQNDQYELLENGLKGKITLTEGHRVGFYSSWQGGGSPFDMQLIRPMTIDLDKPWGKTKYDHWGMKLDEEDGSYSVSSCYGVCDSFFGN